MINSHKLATESSQISRSNSLALDLIAAHRERLKRSAQRYSLCADDAEDAYQHALEVLLTKAPTDEVGQLLPWMHAVVKHEAMLIRRQRERLVSEDELSADGVPSDRLPLDEEAERLERTARATAVLRSLKEQEFKCLLLKASGYSYNEISSLTGYSWTKVNRSISEGRRRFLDRFHSSESGRNCDALRQTATQLVHVTDPAR